MKRGLKDFDIDIYNLSNKKHEYEFEVGDGFFQQLPDSFLQKGDLKAKLVLDKSETMMQASFDIVGIVEIECDRSAELFDFVIKTNDKLIFKFGDEYQELTEDIVVIPRSAPKINVAQYVYEFIVLAIPIKKIHPKSSNPDMDDEAEDDDDTEGNLIYSTGMAKPTDSNEEEIPNADPRWAALANLKIEKPNK